MANMSYCRFQNTLGDLRDCAEHLHDHFDDSQNGRDYVGIGSLMRQRGLVGGEGQYPTTMQGLMAWLRKTPRPERPSCGKTCPMSSSAN